MQPSRSFGSKATVRLTVPTYIQDERVYSPIDRAMSWTLDSPSAIREEEDSQMGVWWNRAMCKEMKIPEGYQEVAVLIIKWSEEIDELNCGEEVKQLDELFRETFNYRTRIADIHNRSHPQLQLNHIIPKFIEDYNGPHNLLIIYYTGHGSFNESTGFLEIHASSTQENTPMGIFPAKASWNEAEQPLMKYADADLLSIFDTCFAANIIQKSAQHEDPRTYELLTASGHDKQTVGPGPRSFTTALIGALKELHARYKDKPFTTRQLCEEINLRPERRRNQSHVWSRFKRYDRYIALAPLKRLPLEQRQMTYLQTPTKGFLFLRLPLTTERLSEKQISNLARGFSKAVKDAKVPVKRIDWYRIRSSSRTTGIADLGLAFQYGKKWLKIVRTRKMNNVLSLRNEGLVVEEDQEENPKSSSNSRSTSFSSNGDGEGAKRKRDDMDEVRRTRPHIQVLTPQSMEDIITGPQNS